MKDFMLLFAGTNYNDMDLSPEDLQKKMAKWWEWSAKLEEKGILKGGHALKSAVRRIDGNNRIVTDRSSAELKEVIGGYFIISAKDINEASEIAQDYPDYDIGGRVEIREFMIYEK